MPEAWLERTGAEVMITVNDLKWKNISQKYLSQSQDEIEATGDFISLLSRNGPEKV